MLPCYPTISLGVLHEWRQMPLMVSWLASLSTRKDTQWHICSSLFLQNSIFPRGQLRYHGPSITGNNPSLEEWKVELEGPQEKSLTEHRALEYLINDKKKV